MMSGSDMFADDGLTAEIARRSAAASARLADAAGEAGLLDVAYGFADSPFGSLLVAVTPVGLVRVAYPDRDFEGELKRLAADVSPRIMESPRAIDAIRRELEEYFDGTRQRFSVRPDITRLKGFTRSVLERTARIPYGSLTTYKEVAAESGSPRAFRAAGNALGSNPVPIVVPCHRVVASRGGLGGYTGGVDRKVALLRLEGSLRRDDSSG